MITGLALSWDILYLLELLSGDAEVQNVSTMHLADLFLFFS